MDILKENILSLTVMVNKILFKTIKVTVKDCFIYIPEVIRLFFKLLLLFFIEPY